MTTTTARKPRSTPTECEATAICEGYSWDVFLAPTDVPPEKGGKLSGPLIDAIACCIEPLLTSLPKAPGGGQQPDFSTDQAAWNLWCCRTKAALITFYTSGPQSNCTYVSTLQSLECPSVNDQAFESKMQSAWAQ